MILEIKKEHIKKAIAERKQANKMKFGEVKPGLGEYCIISQAFKGIFPESNPLTLTGYVADRGRHGFYFLNYLGRYIAGLNPETEWKKLKPCEIEITFQP